MTTGNEKQTEVDLPAWLEAREGYLLVTGNYCAGPGALALAAKIVTLTNMPRIITGAGPGVDQAVVNACEALGKPYTAIGVGESAPNGARQYHQTYPFTLAEAMPGHLARFAYRAIFIVAPGDPWLRTYQRIHEDFVRRQKDAALWMI